jgi:hypothetical protein
MDFGRIVKRLKQIIDRRGGTKALKEDLSELRQIAREKGSLADKAKQAGAALKHAGTPGDPQGAPGAMAKQG